MGHGSSEKIAVYIKEADPHGFKGCVKIPESFDFQSQFDLLNIIIFLFSKILFLPVYTFEWKVLSKQIRKFTDCLIIDQNAYDFK